MAPEGSNNINDSCLTKMTAHGFHIKVCLVIKIKAIVCFSIFSLSDVHTSEEVFAGYRVCVSYLLPLLFYSRY